MLNEHITISKISKPFKALFETRITKKSLFKITHSYMYTYLKITFQIFTCKKVVSVMSFVILVASDYTSSSRPAIQLHNSSVHRSSALVIGLNYLFVSSNKLDTK